MKMYRPVIRDTSYSESYKTFDSLFRTKKSLKEWFKRMQDRHDDAQADLGDRYQDRFPYVLVGIEEVNVK